MPRGKGKKYSPVLFPCVPTKTEDSNYYRRDFSKIFVDMVNFECLDRDRFFITYMVWCRMQDETNNTRHRHTVKWAGVDIEIGECVFVQNYFTIDEDRRNVYDTVMGKNHKTADAIRSEVRRAIDLLEQYSLITSRKVWSTTVGRDINVYRMRSTTSEKQEIDNRTDVARDKTVFVNKTLEKCGIKTDDILDEKGDIDYKKAQLLTLQKIEQMQQQLKIYEEEKRDITCGADRDA